ncbi:MAG: transposase [Candidatus Latescibacteria bacterium]|jgi:REP element-mobilizing transposase RayT|nr:transposase [Candidatus Latescibacterota bacterium]
MKLTPHASNLRKNRLSIPGCAYHIVHGPESRARPFIPNPWKPARDHEVPQIVIDGLRWQHQNGRIHCEAYVVMPDHLHIIMTLEDGYDISQIVRSFGSFTARRINKLQEDKGRFWNHGFYDHRIKDRDELARQLNYVSMNPVKKGYVRRPEDWPYLEIGPDW